MAITDMADNANKNLHSTIFILKLLPVLHKKQVNLHLHSTIFILKLQKELLETVFPVFTFYYIYIKTQKLHRNRLLERYLHSTIFILKPDEEISKPRI